MRGEGFPAVGRGRAVGLLGGSFDPPHEGHVAITEAALVRFGLDEVWWLPSPGNPLKRHGPAPLERRMAAAQRLMRHPRVRISDAEARLGTRYTADTLEALQRHYPHVRFVWLMGADNLVQLPHWEGWRRIMDGVPVGVLARPGMTLAARLSLPARLYRQARIPAHASTALARAEPPAWCFVNLPLVPASSTALRDARVLSQR